MEELAPVSRQAASEGMVLLENRDGVLPLRSGENIALFGRCQIDTYRSGTGSGGAVNVPYAINALDGLKEKKGIEINQNLLEVYQQWLRKNPFDDGAGGWAAEPWCQIEMPLSGDITSRASQESDKAIVFLGRTAGESKDHKNERGSYQLTVSEESMISSVCTHFDKVIIIFNTTAIMDMSWLEILPQKDSIKGVLCMWAGGMEGGKALADILCGDLSPSGRLTDTIVRQLDDHPSSSNFGGDLLNLYQEDIYLGYRYFETFAPDAVQYPFGYGLSYASFKHEEMEFACSGTGRDMELYFEFNVTNVGKIFSGKDVIQIYVEAPQGKLGKPKRALIGFEKTQTLKPEEKQKLRIGIPIASLASYDDGGKTGHRSCSVLEAGVYRFAVGENVRDAVTIDSTLELPELIVIQSHEEAMAPIQNFERIKPGRRDPKGTYSISYETVPQRSFSMEDRILSDLPQSLNIKEESKILLKDVNEGKASLENFIAQIPSEDLASLVLGEGMCSPKVSPGTASAFGGTSPNLFNFGLPTVAASDGPSGIRMDSGHKASQVPIGLQLACTWNRSLNEELYTWVGKEMRSYEIDTLLGPGINLHRHPLNGRNFEYFSEDPLLTGEIATAQVKGLASVGVSGTIKHLVCNEQESERYDVDSVVSERALRELYLKPFELVVKSGHHLAIMTAYNPINGHWAASNYDLNTTILRNEWGYTGIVMSDWWADLNHPFKGGEKNRKAARHMVRAQNDLYMVVGHDKAQEDDRRADILLALDEGELSLGELQRCAMNICRFLLKSPAMERPLIAFDPIKAFSPDHTEGQENLSFDEKVTLETTVNKSAHLKIEKDGVYQMKAMVRHPGEKRAQSACSLYLGGEFSCTIDQNGTLGEWKEVSPGKVRLQEGIYTLGLDFVKPGLELKSLSFEILD